MSNHRRANIEICAELLKIYKLINLLFRAQSLDFFHWNWCFTIKFILQLWLSLQSSFDIKYGFGHNIWSRFDFIRNINGCRNHRKYANWNVIGNNIWLRWWVFDSLFLLQFFPQKWYKLTFAHRENRLENSNDEWIVWFSLCIALIWSKCEFYVKVYLLVCIFFHLQKERNWF